MPFTAQQKRDSRAAKSIAAGRRPRPQKHPCLREQLPPPCAPAPKQNALETQLTMEEQTNRKAMEVEDCRAHMADVVRASAPFMPTWLQPGQLVTVRPHYEHVLQMGASERGIRYCLHQQNSAGLWQLKVAEGLHKGHTLCFDVPREALMP